MASQELVSFSSCQVAIGEFQLGPIDLHIHAGEMVAVLGSSGAGKSTLLKTVNGLMNVTAGTALSLGKTPNQLKAQALRKLRSNIGYVIQDFGLVDSVSAIENVLHGSLHLLKVPRVGYQSYPMKLQAEAARLLATVGLQGKEFSFVENLSGGQRQRVAIARALMQKPSVILADEPVSSLDSKTADQIMKLLRDLADSQSIAVLVSVHNHQLAKKHADQILGLKSGRQQFLKKASELSPRDIEDLYG